MIQSLILVTDGRNWSPHREFIFNLQKKKSLRIELTLMRPVAIAAGDGRLSPHTSCCRADIQTTPLLANDSTHLTASCYIRAHKHTSKRTSAAYN